MSSPWLMSSGWLAFFSLYVGVRSSQLTGVTVHSSQASSVCSGRWLWTNSVQRSGSRPRASSEAAISSVRVRSRAGIVGARQGVVVDDAVDRLVLPLERDVVADRPEVVAEVDDARRLDAAEDARPLGRGARRRGGGSHVEGHGAPSVPDPMGAGSGARRRGRRPLTPARLRYHPDRARPARRRRDEPGPTAAGRRARRGDRRPGGRPGVRRRSRSGWPSTAGPGSSSSGSPSAIWPGRAPPASRPTS